MQLRPPDVGVSNPAGSPRALHLQPELDQAADGLRSGWLILLRHSPRLHTDGSCKPENVRRRLQWLAYERQIPEKDLPKVQCDPTDELLDFAEKHHVSLDWLLGGDLKGLHRMMGTIAVMDRVAERPVPA